MYLKLQEPQKWRTYLYYKNRTLRAASFFDLIFDTTLEKEDEIFLIPLTHYTMQCIVYDIGRYCMDIQLKKGLLEFCVLAVLNKSDSYGYQIIKDISACVEISESTLYPILKRLEANSYLETYSVEHNSRLRKYYKITNKGKDYIKEFLEEWQQVMEIYYFIKGERNYE